MKRLLQSLPSGAEQSERTHDTTLEPFKVGDALPMHMTVADMCRVFQVGPSGFHRRERRGDFRRFEISGSQPKAWSGTRIARFLTGDSFVIAVKRSA